MKKSIPLVLATVALLTCSTVLAQGAPFTPGTYTASADGNNGPVEVQVVFSEDKIDSVEVLSHSETEGISDAAIDRIPKAIVDAQTANVDTVSGATNSSNAIITAVKDTIEQAGADPEALAGETVSYEKSLTAGTYQATRHGHHSSITVETYVSKPDPSGPNR